MDMQISNLLRSLTQQAQYSQSGPAINDMSGVLFNYKDLKPSVESYMFNDGNRKKMICLSGTIPVSYKGTVYNIPIAIWVMQNHPQSAPMCYVKPTLSMSVRQGKHVDANGRIYLPYLSEWRQGVHDLTGLVQVMAIVFGEQPPVFSKPTNPVPPPSRPPYPGVNTPYPPHPTNYVPQGPPSTSYQPTNPPYPATPMGQPPYPNASPGYPSSTPYPPYPSSTGPGYPAPVSQAHGHMPYTPVGQTNMTNQNQLSEDMIKASFKSAVNDKLKRRMKEALDQGNSELSSLRQTEQELKSGQAKLNSIISKLQSETNQVLSNKSMLESKNTEMEMKIKSMEEKQDELNVDEVVSATTPLYKQIVEAFAEEQALEDTIYYLGEGLRRDVVDLDVFLKHVRALARQQFILRATIKKARKTAGLADIY